MFSATTYIPAILLPSSQQRSAVSQVHAREKFHQSVRRLFLQEAAIKFSRENTEDPLWTILLSVMEPISGVQTDFHNFRILLQKEFSGNVQRYRAACDLAHDKLYDLMRATKAYQQFRYEPMEHVVERITERLQAESLQSVFPDISLSSPPMKELLYKQLYHAEHDQSCFVSIDLKAANFNVLRMIDPNLVLNEPTWQELVKRSELTAETVLNSKRLRVRLLGKICPTKLTAAQSHVLRLIFRAVTKFCTDNPLVSFASLGVKDFFQFSCDELLLRTDSPETALRVVGVVREAMQTSLPLCVEQLHFKLSAFQLFQIPYSDRMADDWRRVQAAVNAPKPTNQIPFVLDTYDMDPTWEADVSAVLPKPDLFFFVKQDLFDPSQYAFKHIPFCVASAAHFAFFKNGDDIYNFSRRNVPS